MVSMIQHLVLVQLRHASGSAAETTFLEGCQMLAGIPGVEDFEVLRQMNPDTEWRFAFSMRFADQQAYDDYKVHPDHVAFGEKVWAPAVTVGQDVDLVRL
jgi:heme-degrading monooxygenase HmoA